MPGGTGIFSLLFTVDNLLSKFSSLCPCFCHPRLITVSLFSIVADSQRAAGSGDKKTARLFQSDATTWCVGRDPAVKYVAPLASSFTVPLAAFQQHYVTSCIHIWKHTRTHKHTPEAFSPTHACALWITLISRKTQQQTMSVLFISGLDVPNCFKDFLWLATIGVSKSMLFLLCHFFRKQYNFLACCLILVLQLFIY